jgi:hypothetical protein
MAKPARASDKEVEMLGRTLRLALVLIAALSVLVIALPNTSGAAPTAKEPTVTAQVQVSRKCEVKVIAKWSNFEGVTAVTAAAHIGGSGTGRTILDEERPTTATRGREVFTVQLEPASTQSDLYAAVGVKTTGSEMVAWSTPVSATIQCTFASE